MIRFLLSVCVVSVVSCSGLRVEDRSAEAELNVPGAWAASDAAQAGVDEDWLTRFKDKKLVALVDEALGGNFDLLIAEANLEAAAQDAQIAGAAGKPSVNGTFNGARSRQNFVGFPFGTEGGGVPVNLSNSFGVSLDATWELDLWGRVRASRNVAQANFEATAAEVAAARLSVAGQVAKAYFTVQEAAAQIEVSEAGLKVYEDTEDIVLSRFEAGEGQVGTGAQLRLARSDVATAKATLAGNREAHARAIRQLEVLVGRYPDGKFAPAKELPALAARPPAGLPSELLLRRPDLVAAERKFAASGASIKEAQRALFPRIALSGSAGTSSDDIGDLLDSDFGVWSIGGNLVQPIIAGGQLRAQVAKRKAQDQAAMRVFQRDVFTAFREVESALVAEGFLAQRETALSEAAALAKEAREESRSDYGTGNGDLLTLLNAQTREIGARSALFSARRARLDNRVDLHLALGGDFSLQN